jgi:hypothetical protein
MPPHEILILKNKTLKKAYYTHATSRDVWVQLTIHQLKSKIIIMIICGE